MYLVFGTGKVQKWNEIAKDSEDETAYEAERQSNNVEGDNFNKLK